MKRKIKAVFNFLWWIVKVVDWALMPKGLNRVEFPQYSGGRDLGNGGINTLFDSEQVVGPPPSDKPGEVAKSR